MLWSNKLTKAKITKTILAMSNTRDGGVIIIGMKEGQNKQYEPLGLSKTEADSFNHDDMSAYVRDYADPYVNFTVQRIECNRKLFVCIQVKEFDEIPVICKKDGQDLKKGAIYVRSRTKNESAEASTQAEMRDLMEIATEKGVQKFLSRIESLGLLTRPITTVPNLQFEQQIEDLP